MSIENFKDGQYITYYDNGNVRYITQLINGEQNGIYHEYRENGSLKIRIQYINGKKDGTYNEFNENGNLIKSIQYKNGNKEGVCHYFRDDGTLLKKGVYANNKLIDKYEHFEVNGKNKKANSSSIDLYSDLIDNQTLGPFTLFDLDKLKNGIKLEYRYKEVSPPIINYYNEKNETPIKNNEKKNLSALIKDFFRSDTDYKGDFKIPKNASPKDDVLGLINNEYSNNLKNNIKPEKFDGNEYLKKIREIDYLENKISKIILNEIKEIESKIDNFFMIQGKRIGYTKEELYCYEKLSWLETLIKEKKNEINHEFDAILNQEILKNLIKKEEKYFSIIKKLYWDHEKNDWKNPNNEITMDLMLRQYPNSVSLKKYLPEENNLVYNFEDFWNTFPNHDGHNNWIKSRVLKSKRTECEIYYNNLIKKGIKHKYIILTLKSDIYTRIKNSYRENKLGYLKNTFNYLKDFEINWYSIIEYDLKRFISN